jgi:hypothetical protein
MTLLFGVPITVTLVALLDAARRPQWAWSLADRNQTIWIALILLGVFSVVGGLAICAWYFWRVRPVVAGVEAGRIPDPPRSLRDPRPE